MDKMLENALKKCQKKGHDGIYKPIKLDYREENVLGNVLKKCNATGIELPKGVFMHLACDYWDFITLFLRGYDNDAMVTMSNDLSTLLDMDEQSYSCVVQDLRKEYPTDEKVEKELIKIDTELLFRAIKDYFTFEVEDKVVTDHDPFKIYTIKENRTRCGNKEYLLNGTSGWWNKQQLRRV